MDSFCNAWYTHESKCNYLVDVYGMHGKSDSDGAPCLEGVGDLLCSQLARLYSFEFAVLYVFCVHLFELRRVPRSAPCVQRYGSCLQVDHDNFVYGDLTGCNSHVILNTVYLHAEGVVR